MSEEITQLLITLIQEQKEDINKLNQKVDDLIAFKNRLIAYGVLLSAMFGLIWDWFKNMFSK